MNEKKNSLISTVAAAKNLRRVPGFDPLKYLRTISRDGEKILKLDLSYKKLWFRLACPQGRMLLNPLRITDQMAIFEARVYANKDDAAPLASFTSTQKAHDIPGGLYIRAAQDEALNEALDNAGFGIQLCDVAQVSDGSGYGSEIPLSQVNTAVQTAAPANIPSAELSEKTAVPAETPAADTVPTEQSQADTVPSEPAEVPEQPAAAPIGNEALHQEPAAQTAAEDVTPAPAVEEPIPQAEASVDSTPPEEPNVTTLPAAPQSETAAPAEPEDTAEHTETADHAAAPGGYTEDMTVEAICERMTLEDAKNILVPLGTCKGWTLGQVLDRRATSLRWYMVGCPDASNVLKAGATLLWNARQMQKAG